jgi:hypothetical protein
MIHLGLAHIMPGGYGTKEIAVIGPEHHLAAKNLNTMYLPQKLL